MKKKGSLFLVLILLMNTILQGVSGASLAFAQEQTSPSSALVSNPAETAKKKTRKVLVVKLRKALSTRVRKPLVVLVKKVAAQRVKQLQLRLHQKMMTMHCHQALLLHRRQQFQMSR